uniref:Uncharacterized protein n=1 Tax=Amphimedon queenslandica TaxID=400682 RepID=A0A1X7V7E6_AMPQE
MSKIARKDTCEDNNTVNESVGKSIAENEFATKENIVTSESFEENVVSESTEENILIIESTDVSIEENSTDVINVVVEKGEAENNDDNDNIFAQYSKDYIEGLHCDDIIDYDYFILCTY